MIFHPLRPSQAGYSILTSGFGLSLGFFALCLFPVDALLCTGLCTALTIWAVIAINLTVIPCLLVSFPEYWETSWTVGDCCNGCELPSIARPQASPRAEEPAVAACSQAFC